MRQIPQIKAPTQALQLGQYLMNNAQEGLASNEKKRQDKADNLYRDRKMLQDNEQFNKTFGLNTQKHNYDVLNGNRNYKLNIEKFNEDKRQWDGNNALGWYNATTPKFKMAESLDSNGNPVYSVFNPKLGTFTNTETPVYNKPTEITPYQQTMLGYKEMESNNKKTENKSKLAQRWDDKVIPIIENFDELNPSQQNWMRQKYIDTDGLYNPQVVRTKDGWDLGTGLNDTYEPQGYTNTNSLLKSIEDKINKL